MKRSGFVIAGVLVAVVVFGAMAFFNSVQYAEGGTAKVLTQWGSIKRVYRPDDGWFVTMAPGQKAYDVVLRSFTETTTPRVTSKDNAALQVPISVTAYTDPEMISDYVRK